MDRRQFLKMSAATAGLALLGDWEELFARGTQDATVGKPWTGWKKGQFQVHFIYTGVGESMFYIFPDGTTMLLDCGDHNAIGRGKLAVPTLPGAYRHAGEWIARYVKRVNPQGYDVDYMMLSHYHSDHAGCTSFYADCEKWRGKNYYISGFTQAAQTLTFRRAIDRCYPGADDPFPLKNDTDNCITHMRHFYERMKEEHGTQLETFRLGATDQVTLLHDAASYPSFKVRNICANGRICGEDGVVRDLYAEHIERDHPGWLNENGMSLGMVFSYGPFRFFTAGDFSDNWELPDGTRFEIEDALAEVCGPAHVAKVNHHGHYSMPAKLVATLQSQVYVSCVWDQLHNVAPVMERLADRSIYPGDRVILPGIMPVERRAEDAGSAWLNDVHPATFEGCHNILTVEPGGKHFSFTCLTANDESMTVRSVIPFTTASFPR